MYARLCDWNGIRTCVSIRWLAEPTTAAIIVYTTYVKGPNYTYVVYICTYCVRATNALCHKGERQCFPFKSYNGAVEKKTQTRQQVYIYGRICAYFLSKYIYICMYIVHPSSTLYSGVCTRRTRILTPANLSNRTMYVYIYS